MKLLAFLKAVNVSKTTTIEMERLTNSLKLLGISNCRTLLNSGNVLLDSSQSIPELFLVFRRAIAEQSDKTIEVVIKTLKDVEKVLSGYPFASQEYKDSWKLVYLFNESTEVTLQASFDDLKMPEKVVVSPSAIYVYYPQGIGRSKLTTPLIDKLTGLQTTGRNINTLRRLLRGAAI